MNDQMRKIKSDESTFGAFENGVKDHVGDKELANVVWKQSSESNQTITKQYGFQYEFTDDDDDASDDDDDSNGIKKKRGQETAPRAQFFSRLAASMSSDEKKDPNNVPYSIHLLGKKYHPILDYSLRREDESSLFWFSYRCDFPEIKPNGITSDAGWGCMLRSAQMLLAQAMKMHYCGREWKAPKSTVKQRGDPFVQDLSMWLADFPSTCTGCWYSLHNMVAAGLAKYDVMPGEWFGPGIACHVMRDLTELHERAWKKKYGLKAESNSNADLSSTARVSRQSGYQRHLQPVMRVYVAPEGSIYRYDVEQLMTKDLATDKSKQSNKVNGDDANDDDDEGYDKVDYDSLFKDPLLHPLSEVEEKEKEEKILPSWDTALLILLPLRLGLKTFNASSYKIPLSHALSFPQSVGFVGGSPRHALWFYGSNSDGSKVYGLDPHTVQRAPRRRRLRPEEKRRTGNTKQYQVQLTDEYLRSFNCPNTSSMDMSKIDPSLALGYYCQDRADFESLCTAIDDMKTNNDTKNFPSLFSVTDAKPDYNADLSSAMMDMMMGGSASQMDDDVENTHDDDDFVLL